MSVGLFAACFKDAIVEGDGPRLVGIWKSLLGYFSATKRVKYRIEAFHFLASLFSTLSERTSYQLLHNRVVNPTGKPSGNIPVDLAQEHDNKSSKKGIRRVGSNPNPKNFADVHGTPCN